jgi:hypothetical protein
LPNLNKALSSGFCVSDKKFSNAMNNKKERFVVLVPITSARIYDETLFKIKVENLQFLKKHTK